MRLSEWFSASRHIDFCERQMAIQRADFLDRIAEKDAEIKRLRLELVERNDTIVPREPLRTARVLPQPVEVPAGSLDWQGELNRMIQEEEDGVRSE